MTRAKIIKPKGGKMNNKTKGLLGAIAVIIVAAAFGLVININFNGQNGDTNVNVDIPEAVIDYSDQIGRAHV